MSDRIRVLVVVAEEATLPLIRDPLRQHVDVSVRGFVGGKYLRKFFLSQTDAVFISSEYARYIPSLRGHQPRVRIFVVPEGDIWRERTKDEILSYIRVQDVRDPLHIATRPGTEIIMPRTFSQEVGELVCGLRLRDPMWRQILEYDDAFWTAYWSSTEAVRVNRPAFEVFRERISALANQEAYVGQTILMVAGGGQGSGKTAYELAYKAYIQQMVQKALATGRISKALIKSFEKQVTCQLVPQFVTTRERRFNERLNSREWVKILPPEEELFITIPREGYTNAIRSKVLMNCLREFEIINQILLEGGVIRPEDPVFPLILFLRHPGPQKVRRNLFRRENHPHTVKTAFIQAAKDITYHSTTAQQIDRSENRDIRSQSDGDDRKWRRKQIAVESLRVTMEMIEPLAIYDFIWRNHSGFSPRDRIREIFRRLERHRDSS